jgi:hypothetical protein
VEALRAAGHEVYDFRNPPSRAGFGWEEIDGGWLSWGPVAFLRALLHPLAEAGFRSDFDAMKWAEGCVLVLPCGRSAHLEAGWFSGSGKRLFILLAESGNEPELMYKMATTIRMTVEDIIGDIQAWGPGR